MGWARATAWVSGVVTLGVATALVLKAPARSKPHVRLWFVLTSCICAVAALSLIRVIGALRRIAMGAA